MRPQPARLANLLVLIVLATGCAGPTPTAQPGPTASPSPTLELEPTLAATETPPPLPTVQVGCKDSALYVKDVTVPDNTKLKPGEPFTKTWQLRNTGTCTWNVRYALVFVGGERMDAPITTPLSETAPGETLDISVDLVAPAKEGAHTSLFELRNPTGRALDIGTVTSIWVKIVVENGEAALGSTVAPTLPANSATKVPGQACKPEQKIEYIAQLLALINEARAEAKLAALKPSGQLSFAAQGHSDDMACNNFVGRTGSDGSTAQARVAASGYVASDTGEVIFASGTPQEAFDWWMNDEAQRNILLNPKAMEVGLGYSYLPGTAYGSYYTLDFAAPEERPPGR